MGGFSLIEVMVAQLILSLAMLCAINAQLDFKWHLHQVWQHYLLTLELANGCAVINSSQNDLISSWKSAFDQHFPRVRIGLPQSRPYVIRYQLSIGGVYQHAKEWKC